MLNGQMLIAWFDRVSDAVAAVDAVKASGATPELLDIHVVGCALPGLDEPRAARMKTGFGYWAPSARQRRGVIDRTIEGGLAMVKVKVPDEQWAQVCAVVEDCGPTRMEDRGSNYSKMVNMHVAFKPSRWAA